MDNAPFAATESTQPDHPIAKVLVVGAAGPCQIHLR